jgi:ribosomal protein S18 acetylase RimI-like enzyme
MLEISAIFLEDEFRGKSYNKKAYSEMLMEKALQKIESDYQKNILAYVQNGNKGPNHLFKRYGFLRESSDKDGYTMYSLDFGKI